MLNISQKNGLKIDEFKTHYEVMEIFMDDFSVYGSNFENYLENLEIVL